MADIFTKEKRSNAMREFKGEVCRRLSLKKYFSRMTLFVAARSPCLRKQVGCILTDADGKVLSTGYNGPPSGWAHCRKCRRKGMDPFVDYQVCSAVHAEQNAIAQCRDISEINSCYVTHFPCPACLRLLHNTGCKEIIYLFEQSVGKCMIKKIKAQL